MNLNIRIAHFITNIIENDGKLKSGASERIFLIPHSR